ncbi:MAG: hypothetical protein R2710_02885 [Acidimicrobiales bacterium]
MRALLSVYDKSGIAELAQSLHELRVELVSSGGTAKVITEAGIPVTDVADFTGYPAMLGHRVVTLHPRVHGGLLADRRDPSHLTDLETHHIDLIDIVVGNLYPFGADPESFDHAPQASSEDLIDIGGPAMLRAAAKNHEYVTALVDPADYEPVLEQLRNGGSTSPAMRHRLARKVFAHTSAYDAAIVKWFDETSTTPEVLPETIHLSLERAQDLRYGENPHQQGARYRLQGTSTWWDSAEQHVGAGAQPISPTSSMSTRRWRLVHDLGDGPAVAIIKHDHRRCRSPRPGDRLRAGLDERATLARPSPGIGPLNRVVDEATCSDRRRHRPTSSSPRLRSSRRDRSTDRQARTLGAHRLGARDDVLTVGRRRAGSSYSRTTHFGATSTPGRSSPTRRPTEAEMADAQLAWKLRSDVISNAVAMVEDWARPGGSAPASRTGSSRAFAASKADGRRYRRRRESDGSIRSPTASKPLPMQAPRS